MEYLSESGSESEKKVIIVVNPDDEFTYLHIWFPLPYNFPKPYIILHEVMSNLDYALLKPYVQNYDIMEDPDKALHYIINHFSIKRVLQSTRDFPRLKLKQVYYSTYIDTSQYTKLQHLIDITGKNLRIQNALAQEQLDLQQKYARYYSSDDISPYLLQCLL